MINPSLVVPTQYLKILSMATICPLCPLVMNLDVSITAFMISGLDDLIMCNSLPLLTCTSSTLPESLHSFHLLPGGPLLVLLVSLVSFHQIQCQTCLGNSVSSQVE